MQEYSISQHWIRMRLARFALIIMSLWENDDGKTLKIVISYAYDAMKMSS